MRDEAALGTRSLVRIALFAALIGALGLVPPLYLPIVAGLPISVQSLGVMLAGLILGGRDGALAVALFLLVVALGAPLLSGGRGGLGVFFGPTAGFLLGFLLGVYVIGWLAPRLPGPPVVAAFAAAVIGGIGVVYLFGVPGFALIAHLPLSKALAGSVVFLPGDLVKALLAALAARSLARARPGR
ncbi:biotin transporter BioY [Azorhizobium doebereinerae]|uniref:biotin transporter BioY n=1 Tax=Azorhizobium doebereinerae TaxID=281091 RepID=UPI001FD90705|nr:biotin transporter BioY [Azorhizobium doebereinerae]